MLPAHFAILVVHFDVPILSLYLLLLTVLLLLWLLLYVSLVIIYYMSLLCWCGFTACLARHVVAVIVVVDGHFSLPSACIVAMLVHLLCHVVARFAVDVCVCVSPVHVAAVFFLQVL